MGVTLRESPYAGHSHVYDHPTMKFARMLDKMKEEHTELSGRLSKIAASAAEIRDGSVPEDGVGGTISRLAEGVREFLEQYARHAKDRDDVLFPTVELYVDDLVTTRQEKTALLQQAAGRFRAFLDMTDACMRTDCREQAGQAAESLLDACKTMNHLFLEESNTIYPLAEEIIEDIDYLSC